LYDGDSINKSSNTSTTAAAAAAAVVVVVLAMVVVYYKYQNVRSSGSTPFLEMPTHLEKMSPQRLGFVTDFLLF